VTMIQIGKEKLKMPVLAELFCSRCGEKATIRNWPVSIVHHAEELFPEGWETWYNRLLCKGCVDAVLEFIDKGTRT